MRLQIETLESNLIQELYSVFQQFGLRSKIYRHQKNGKMMMLWAASLWFSRLPGFPLEDWIDRKEKEATD